MDKKAYCRRSIRLRGYDYGLVGGYFLTICIHNRQQLLGHVQDGQMIPNDAGLMVVRRFFELAHKFPNLRCDEFICMPDHVHGIIFVERMGTSLPKVVQWFKTMTTNEYIWNVKRKRFSPFEKRLWQRNYWERIIRDESELDNFREYIRTNPIRWELRRKHAF